MDFFPTLQWRLEVRRRYRMPLEACEFMRHAGRSLLVDWRGHLTEAGSIELIDALVVERRFEGVAQRMMQIDERYYEELADPTSSLHTANVQHALATGSGCLRATSEWLKFCTAPQSVIEDIFEIVRNAVGEIAKAPRPMSHVEAEDVAHSTLVRMDERRRRAACVGPIFA
jgi:hypothetical protein